MFFGVCDTESNFITTLANVTSFLDDIGFIDEMGFCPSLDQAHHTDKTVNACGGGGYLQV